MLFCEGHRRIETDDREVARHMHDCLNDRFAYLSFQVIKLRSVIPGEGRAVVAVIDISDIARVMVTALKDNGCIGLIIVMVFEMDAYSRIIGEVLGIK